MTDLDEAQWELAGVRFGLDCRVQSDPDVQPPSSSTRGQRTPNPVGDSQWFGVARRTPGTWAFKLFVDETDEESALDALEEIATVWDAYDVRNTPGAVMALRYRMAGRDRRVYGQPNRFTSPLDNRLMNGYIAITADFELASPYFFDDVEESVDIDAQPAESTGGFEVPFDAPITFSQTSPTEDKQIVVTGRYPAPVQVDFHGPALNPSLTVAGWTIRLNTSVPEDDVYTVSALPWDMGVTRKDGSFVEASVLSRQTRLAELVLPKGTHTASHSVEDTLGRSKATVRWRNAHLTP